MQEDWTCLGREAHGDYTTLSSLIPSPSITVNGPRVRTVHCHESGAKHQQMGAEMASVGRDFALSPTVFAAPKPKKIWTGWNYLSGLWLQIALARKSQHLWLLLSAALSEVSIPWCQLFYFRHNHVSGSASYKCAFSRKLDWKWLVTCHLTLSYQEQMTFGLIRCQMNWWAKFLVWSFDEVRRLC